MCVSFELGPFSNLFGATHPASEATGPRTKPHGRERSRGAPNAGAAGEDDRLRAGLPSIDPLVQGATVSMLISRRKGSEKMPIPSVAMAPAMSTALSGTGTFSGVFCFGSTRYIVLTTP